MSALIKVALVALCSIALILVTLRFIVPLVAMYMAGVGVAVPLPERFVTAYPKLAIYLFVFGGPLLFAVLVAIGIWLLRLRMSPR